MPRTAYYIHPGANRTFNLDKINEIIDRRNAARTAKDFIKADQLRAQLTDVGLVVRDYENCTGVFFADCRIDY